MDSKEGPGAGTCGANCPYRNPRWYELLLLGAGAFACWALLSTMAGIECFRLHDEHEQTPQEVVASQKQDAGGSARHARTPLPRNAVSEPHCSDKGEETADCDPAVTTPGQLRQDQRATRAERTPDQVFHSRARSVSPAQGSAKAGA